MFNAIRVTCAGVWLQVLLVLPPGPGVSHSSDKATKSRNGSYQQPQLLMAHPSHGFPKQPLSDTNLCLLHSKAQPRELPAGGTGLRPGAAGCGETIPWQRPPAGTFSSNPADPSQWKHHPGAARKAAACLEKAQVAAQASQLSAPQRI